MMARWRQVIRTLQRDATFSTVTILTLAIAIAATVAVFSLVNGVLLAQLPYPEAERLVEIDHVAPGLGINFHMGIAPKLYLAYLERHEVFEEIALYRQSEATLTGDATPERVTAVRATPSLFRVLGITAARGRAFSQAEGRPGGPVVAVLSHRLWHRRFGGDLRIVGQSIRVDGVSHEVIGIMPRGFSFPQRGVDLWLPRVVDPSTAAFAFSDNGLARLAPGLAPAAAETQLSTLTASLAAAFPEDESALILERGGFAPHIETRLERVVGGVRTIMWMLLATVGLILAIACANVANLFLVRVEERASELAIKSALGASRGHLLRGLLRESFFLAVIAGGAGLCLAGLAIRFIVYYGPDSIPRLEEVGIDVTVLIFAAIISLGSGLLFGLLPALRATAPRLATFLKEGGRAPTAGQPRQRLRNLLVITQMALGVVLLITAGLVARSLWELRNVDPGFRTADALTFRLFLPAADYPEAADRVRFAEEASERLASLPGVTAVGVADTLPLSGKANGSGYTVEGLPEEEGAIPTVFIQTMIGPGFLKTMGIPLVEGRSLTTDDYRLRSGNIMISHSIARRLWPGESALGKRLAAGEPGEDAWLTVVGVAGDVHHFGLQKEPPDMVYLPFLGPPADPEDVQDLGPGLSFVLRVRTPPESLAAALRAEIWALDRNLPIAQARTLDSMVEEDRARLSFTVTVLLVASLMALIIAAVGLYGVIAYLVSRRTHEIGIRMALGAAAGQTRRMVLRQGLGIATAGAAVGILLALATTRLLESILYGVDSRDPLTFIALPLLLLGVALAATYIPAWHASQIEPMEALRHD